MHPIHDIDAPLLMALALASKRRPAELVELIAATELMHGSVPSEFKLSDAFYRLSTQGLIRAEGDGFTLTAAAQLVMEGGTRKSDKAARIESLKQGLAAYATEGEHAALIISTDQLRDAIAVLGPRRRATVDYARKDKQAAQWRQAAAARRRKS